MKSEFKTPLLLLVFNRPNTTQQVMNVLKQIQPKFLYVAADGPRAQNLNDATQCAATKKVISESITWDCEIKTLYRETNLGCGRAVSSAISWFFENVPEGIILEDDVLPTHSFFPFCEELLERYRNESSVKIISGSNLLPAKETAAPASYFFSEYAGIWGWASWRRAWQGYDFKISSWDTPEAKDHFKKGYTPEQFLFFENVFNSVGTPQSGTQPIDTWDYQWWYQRLIQNGLGIIPSVNLTRNIGFNSDATHTVNMHTEIKEAVTTDLSLPLIHPTRVEKNSVYDLKLAKKYFWKDRFFWQKILRKLTS